MKKIYLAGPDVFRKDSLQHFEKLKSMCKKHGFEGLSSFDNEIKLSNNKTDNALTIFRSNIKLIDISDIIVANIQPFRGACIDDGTAGEILYGFGKDKLICGYSKYCNLNLSQIVKKFKPSTKIFDKFTHIEEFGLSYNLMIYGAIHDSGGIIVKTFEEALIFLDQIYNY